jgi:hypothetical protein
MNNMDADLHINYKAGKPNAGCYLGSVFKFSYAKTKHGGCYVGDIDEVQIVHDASNMIAIFHPCCSKPELFTSPKKIGTVACVAKVESP